MVGKFRSKRSITVTNSDGCFIQTRVDCVTEQMHSNLLQRLRDCSLLPGGGSSNAHWQGREARENDWPVRASSSPPTTTTTPLDDDDEIHRGSSSARSWSAKPHGFTEWRNGELSCARQKDRDRDGCSRRGLQRIGISPCKV